MARARKQSTHSPESFTETSPGDGIWVAEAVALLSEAALDYLLGRSRDEIIAGAGFSITGLGSTVLNERNQVVPRILYEPVEFKLEFPERTVVDPPDWQSTGFEWSIRNSLADLSATSRIAGRQQFSD